VYKCDCIGAIIQRDIRLDLSALQGTHNTVSRSLFNSVGVSIPFEAAQPLRILCARGFEAARAIFAPRCFHGVYKICRFDSYVKTCHDINPSRAFPFGIVLLFRKNGICSLPFDPLFSFVARFMSFKI